MRFLKRYHINIFDIIVACVVVAIIGSLIWLRASRRSQWISIRLVVSNDDQWWEGSPPQWWYIDSLEKGQTSRNSIGESIAEITNIQSFDAGAYRRRAFIDIRVKGSYDTKRQVYLFNYQPLQIGKPLDFLFGKNNIHGIVTYIDTINIPYTEKTIEVKLLGARTWVAESYTKGLEMKDLQGNMLARIDKVDIHPATWFQFSDIRGQLIQVYNPEAKDVILTVTLKTFSSNGNLYFVDRASIKIGEHIWFQFPEAVARDAEIIKILK